MAVSTNPIASHIAIQGRYVRAVDMARDLGDSAALDGYVVTPTIRDAVVRILHGLSEQSSQRAFRVVGPYGAGKSAFGILVARIFEEKVNGGIATRLLRNAIDKSVPIASWKPVVINGRRKSFARELLNQVICICDEFLDGEYENIRDKAKVILDASDAPDAQIVTSLVSEVAERLRSQTGAGLLLLVDEMGRYLEHAAVSVRTEDPSIFQTIAECAGGRVNANFSIVCFLHHRFVDYISEQSGWIESEWARSAERYEEIAFHGSTEQTLFLLARALEPVKPHTAAIQRRAKNLYVEAVRSGIFAVSRKDIIQVAANLYPLHPTTVSTLCLVARRFGQNERSVFSFLQSLEPASFKRYIQVTRYSTSNWYRIPLVFDYISETIPNNLRGTVSRRYSLAYDALAITDNLSEDHHDVLKTIALIAILEPVPGLRASSQMISWSLGIKEDEVKKILDELEDMNVIYCRPHRRDYSLWSSSSVDLSRWLDEAKTKVHSPKRIEEISSMLTTPRPAVAHRHYHRTGTLRTFDVALWLGDAMPSRKADGLILIVPVYPGEEANQVIHQVSSHVGNEPLVLICARRVTASDLNWAHELAIWNWIRNNCEELRLDELARAEVSDRINSAIMAMTSSVDLLSIATCKREEYWIVDGQHVSIPDGELSMLLSDVCDKVFCETPILRNELINRSKLSTAIASARMRLLDRMLNNTDQENLGIEGSPPEKTIYLSLFKSSGIHCLNTKSVWEFGKPGKDSFWRPIWCRIDELLSNEQSLDFAELLGNLEAAPYGLRGAPALLLIIAYVIAHEDNISVMERNTFQPDLTTAHLMRLAKNPRNFALRIFNKDKQKKGLLESLATSLDVLGVGCRPTLRGISERLFSWYNSLSPYALKTKSISVTAISIRNALAKAKEPSELVFHDLPVAAGMTMCSTPVENGRYFESLNAALLELDHALPKLRSRAVDVVLEAFRAPSLDALQFQVVEDFGPHKLSLGEYRLSVFVDRVMNREVSPELWLDGIAGHLVGMRPEKWTDETLDKFDYEIRLIQGTLARWLSLFEDNQSPNSDLHSIHVVGADGREEVVVIRSDQQNSAITARLESVRNVLGADAEAMEILAQLLVECADRQASQRK